MFFIIFSEHALKECFRMQKDGHAAAKNKKQPPSFSIQAFYTGFVFEELGNLIPY